MSAVVVVVELRCDVTRRHESHMLDGCIVLIRIFEGLMLHEMFHCLGLGTMWTEGVHYQGTEYIGTKGVEEWNNMGCTGPMPMANDQAHWDDDCFNTEGMCAIERRWVRVRARVPSHAIPSLFCFDCFSGYTLFEIRTPCAHFLRVHGGT